MHQLHRVRGILTHPIPLIRAFLLCLLLLGSQLATFAGFFSYAEAAGHAHGGIRPQAISATKSTQVISKTAHPVVVSHVAGKSTHTAVSHVKSANSLKSVRPNIVGKHHVVNAATPDIGLNVTGPSNVTVGVPATYTFTASNAASAAPLTTLPTPLIATITLPTGFTGLTASATSGWSFVTSGTLVTATYTGPLPINPGDILPAISVTGTPTAALQGVPANLQTVIGTVVAPGDTNLSNNTVSLSLTPTTAADTATSTATPTTTAVATSTSVVPTATGTVGTGSINVTLNKIVAGASTYSIGQNVTYDLIVSTAGNSATIPAGTPIEVEDIVPLGLSNITTSSSPGGSWGFTQSSPVSPSDVIATYTGTYPIAPGTTLATIMLTGTINSNIGPAFTNTADLFVPNNAGNSSSTSTISITGATGTPTTGTVTATGTATATETGTVTTGTVTATSTPPTPCTGLTPVTGTSVTGTAVTGTETVPVTAVAGTETVPVTATTSGSPVATGSSNCAYPDLAIVKTTLEGDKYQTGDNVTFILVVSNTPGAGTIYDPSTISVEDVLPIGLKNIKVHGDYWKVDSSDSASPTMIAAHFTGKAPVYGSTVLPSLVLTGVLTKDAMPTFTATAYADVPGDIYTDNNIATYTIFVKEQQNNNNNNNNNHNHNNNHNNNNNNRNNRNNHVINCFCHGASGFAGGAGGAGGPGGVPGLPLTGGDPNQE